MTRNTHQAPYELRVDGRLWASCVPVRAAPGARPAWAPRRLLQLQPALLMRREGPALSLQAPAAWARLLVHEPGVWRMLHTLAAGCTVRDVAAVLGTAPRIANELLALMQWCGLLNTPTEVWPAHERLLHAHTRRGYADAPIGKQAGALASATPPAAGGVRVRLPKPDEQTLIATDASHAQVALQRRSLREQGRRPLSLVQLAEFLWRCFAERDGHRPYPSGGALHALTPHLLVRACEDLAPGVYTYVMPHGLRRRRHDADALAGLLHEAAATAGITHAPQMLCVLSADMARLHAAYGGLAYSLALKEVGAVMQTAALAASAMQLAVCPLGTGNAMAFERLTGLKEVQHPAVGEFMLGSRAP